MLYPTTASIRCDPPGKYHSDMCVATMARMPAVRSSAVVSRRASPRRGSTASRSATVAGASRPEGGRAGAPGGPSTRRSSTSRRRATRTCSSGGTSKRPSTRAVDRRPRRRASRAPRTARRRVPAAPQQPRRSRPCRSTCAGWPTVSTWTGAAGSPVRSATAQADVVALGVGGAHDELLVVAGDDGVDPAGGAGRPRRRRGRCAARTA